MRLLDLFCCAGEVLQWLYPLISGGYYEILYKEKIDAFRKKAEAYDRYTNQYW